MCRVKLLWSRTYQQCYFICELIIWNSIFRFSNAKQLCLGYNRKVVVHMYKYLSKHSIILLNIPWAYDKMGSAAQRRFGNHTILLHSLVTYYTTVTFASLFECRIPVCWHRSALLCLYASCVLYLIRLQRIRIAIFDCTKNSYTRRLVHQFCWANKAHSF